MPRYIGSARNLSQARWVIIGAPTDATASRVGGSRLGPGAIRAESLHLESFSLYHLKDVADVLFYDVGDLALPPGDVDQAMGIIEATNRKFIERKKKVLLLGGDHLVSYGAIKAASCAWPHLRVVHLDAHADLRDRWMGNRFTHATVMRRAAEGCLEETKRLYQFGIRSCSAEEYDWGMNHTHLFPFNLTKIEDCLDELSSVPVYVSIDIDVVDPSAAPGTGTPEPGGATPDELLRALEAMKGLDVVGIDLVEVSPPQDINGITAALAAKVIREALILWG